MRPDVSTLSDAQWAVFRDARRLLADQRTLAEQAPSTGPLADAVATPFGQGYVLGVVDALCQRHGAPFDTTAYGIFGVVLESILGRPVDVELDAAIECLARGNAMAHESPYGFDTGREYGGNEALGWARSECVPCALVHMARVSPVSHRADRRPFTSSIHFRRPTTVADTSAIREHMEVVGANGGHIGTVDHLDG